VPLLAIVPGVSALEAGGKLADVAPTLAAVIGMSQPAEWTGRSLLVY
jgi:2,3-bisphosphoglycerate-independent phosphoglycerate mutase